MGFVRTETYCKCDWCGATAPAGEGWVGDINGHAVDDPPHGWANVQGEGLLCGGCCYAREEGLKKAKLERTKR